MDLSVLTSRRTLSFGARSDASNYGVGTIVKALLFEEAKSDVSYLFTL